MAHEGWARYSQNTDRAHQLIPHIRYHGGNSVTAPIRGGPDDPGSELFVPLDKRNDLEQARFWARQFLSKQAGHQEAEFDA